MKHKIKNWYNRRYGKWGPLAPGELLMKSFEVVLAMSVLPITFFLPSEFWYLRLLGGMACGTFTVTALERLIKGTYLDGDFEAEIRHHVNQEAQVDDVVQKLKKKIESELPFGKVTITKVPDKKIVN